MKDLIPAKISVCCFLFIVVLFVTGALDFGLTALLISLTVIYRQPAIYLFFGAFFSFILYLTFVFLGLRLETVADLSVTSYILFAAGLVLYFLQGQKNQWLLNLPLVKHVTVSKSQLWKFGGILILTLLIYPLTSALLALVTAYFLFLLVFHRFSDGRYAFAVALFFLLLCPILLIGKKDKIAETSAIFTYYFLVIGVVQEIIDIIRHPQKEDEIEIEANTINKAEELSEYKKLKINSISLFDRFKKIPEPIYFGFAVFILTVCAAFVLPKMLPAGLTLLFNTSVSQVKSPLGVVPTAKPTIISQLLPGPTLTLDTLKDKVASDIPKLNLSVENGTTISGLASSTAAKLKPAGFVNIFIGNAVRSNYANWEIIMKNKKEELTEYLKRLLQLTSLDIKEASPGAKYDIVIIVGDGK